MRGRRGARDATGGFLLTETLATFAISAVVLVGLVSVSSVLLRAVDRSVLDVQGSDDLGRTLAAIRRDLSELTRARFDGVEPQPFVFRGGPNSLFFAKREQDAAGIPETRVVAIREIVAGPSKRLTRADARLPVTAASFADLRYGAPRDLATGKARLRFGYIGRQASRMAPLPSWTNDRSLPVAVLVDAIDIATGRVIVSVRVPIRADGDIGCIGAGSARTAALAAPSATSTAPPLSVQAPPFRLAPIGAAADDEFCAATDAAGSRL